MTKESTGGTDMFLESVVYKTAISDPNSAVAHALDHWSKTRGTNLKRQLWLAAQMPKLTILAFLFILLTFLPEPVMNKGIESGLMILAAGFLLTSTTISFVIDDAKAFCSAFLSLSILVRVDTRTFMGWQKEIAAGHIKESLENITANIYAQMFFTRARYVMFKNLEEGLKDRQEILLTRKILLKIYTNALKLGLVESNGDIHGPLLSR